MNLTRMKLYLYSKSFFSGTQPEIPESKWFASLLHSSSYMYYASFMLTRYSVEELNKNDDDMSFVTGVTGTNGNIFTRFNILAEFGHAVDKSQSESKMKQTSAASGHLQDFMDPISHQPSQWGYLEYCHRTHGFWGNFVT